MLVALLMLTVAATASATSSGFRCPRAGGRRARRIPSRLRQRQSEERTHLLQHQADTGEALYRDGLRLPAAQDGRLRPQQRPRALARGTVPRPRPARAGGNPGRRIQRICTRAVGAVRTAHKRHAPAPRLPERDRAPGSAEAAVCLRSWPGQAPLLRPRLAVGADSQPGVPTRRGVSAELDAGYARAGSNRSFASARSSGIRVG